MGARFWGDLKTTDFAHLSAEDSVAVLPLAAIEQHGPHLPVSVDTTIMNAMLAEAMPLVPAGLDVLVLPTLVAPPLLLLRVVRGLLRRVRRLARPRQAARVVGRLGRLAGRAVAGRAVGDTVGRRRVDGVEHLRILLAEDVGLERRRRVEGRDDLARRRPELRRDRQSSGYSTRAAGWVCQPPGLAQNGFLASAELCCDPSGL